MEEQWMLLVSGNAPLVTPCQTHRGGRPEETHLSVGSLLKAICSRLHTNECQRRRTHKTELGANCIIVCLCWWVWQEGTKLDQDPLCELREARCDTPPLSFDKDRA